MKLNFTDLKKWFIPQMEKIAVYVFNKLIPFKAYLATVDSVSTDYATVTLVGDSTSLSNIVNKTGETLSASDRVWVWAINGDLSDAFIAFRLENDIA